jgi:hypothetical protein
VVSAHALGQDDSEAIEQRGLSGVRLSKAAQPDLAVGCCEQDDVVGLDAGEFLEHAARRAAQAGALLPLLQALPQDAPLDIVVPSLAYYYDGIEILRTGPRRRRAAASLPTLRRRRPRRRAFAA